MQVQGFWAVVRAEVSHHFQDALPAVRHNPTHPPFFLVQKLIPGREFRPFDHDRMSITVVISSTDNSPYCIVQSHHMGNPVTSFKGGHELCISREGSALVLKRWSRRENCAKYWAVLYFITWEGELAELKTASLSIPLTHVSRDGAFPLLFCRPQVPQRAVVPASPRRVQAHWREAAVPSVRILVPDNSNRADLAHRRIIDDGFQHSLIVYKDQDSRGIRLHAAVWDGELRQCPVWTAFGRTYHLCLLYQARHASG